MRPGKAYHFRVLAQNAQGQGLWSQPLQASTAADVPGAPSQPVCSKRTATGFTVKWVAPEVENGAPVVSYRCARLLLASATCKMASCFWVSRVLRILTCSCSFLLVAFMVNLKDSVPIHCVTDCKVPFPPIHMLQIDIIQHYYNTVSVWDMHTACMSPQNAASYAATEKAADRCHFCRLQCHNDTHNYENVYHGSSVLHKLQGLEAGTSYSLRVAAVNAVGKGAWSEEASFATTRLPPEPPAGLECTLDADPLHR